MQQEMKPQEVLTRAYCQPLTECLSEEQLKQGLSPAAVAQSRESYGENRLAEKRELSFFERVKNGFKEPILLLLVFAGALTVVVNGIRLAIGHPADFWECLGIGIAVLLSIGLSVLMEQRSARAFEALRKMGSRFRVRVLRAGHMVELPGDELVVGDIVVLSIGERIAADGRLVESCALHIDESTLTGESVPVEKEATAQVAPEAPLAERVTMVYAGTFVAQGSGRFCVTAVGMATEFGKIAGELATVSQGSTPLQEKMAKMGERITLVGAGAAAVIFLLQLVLLLWQGGLTLERVLSAFISAIVLIVASVPEGLPTIVAVSLAISVLKLAREHALVKKLIACETIGCVNVICSDKTGTLTRNQMSVVGIMNAAGTATLTPTLQANMCINVSAQGRETPTEWAWMGNPTECALLTYAQGQGIAVMDVRNHATIATVQPFSSDTKQMVTTVRTATGTCTYFKGAPERILETCDSIVRQTAFAAMRPWQQRACRVLAFAHQETEGAYQYDGFVAIVDPLRPDVIEAVKTCRRAGVALKILTGDNLLTAQAIAHELGALSAGSTVVEARTIEALSDEALKAQLPQIAVIARSTPSIKRRVVSLLKSDGHVVAVTGDGINDAPAIQQADVGVAMGITGTDVTKEACDIVLLDDAFSTIVRAIQWGRGIYENFQRFILFQLTVNLSAVSFVLLSVAMGYATPFSALELLWINLIMDGPPALTLGLEPIRKTLLDRAPIARDASIITRAMLIRILCVGGYIAALCLAQQRFNFLGATPLETASAGFTLFVFCQLFNAFNARELGHSPLLRYLFSNPIMLLSFLITFSLQWCITEFGGSFFGTEPLSLSVWGKLLAFSLSVLPVSELCRWGIALATRPSKTV